MKQKKWWIIGGIAAVLALAVVLGLTLGGKKEQGWTQLPEPGKDTLNVDQIPGFKPGTNAPGQQTAGGTEPGSAGPAQTLPVESKPAASAPGETKPAESKPEEGGATESKPAQTEPGQTSPVEETKPEQPATEPTHRENETTAPQQEETEPRVTEPEETDPKPTEPEPTEPEETEPPLPMLSDECLTLTSLGGYSGNYLEDGTDELVSNVAAILVTNNGDRMLQVADITFQVNDTEQATFRITDLPAGTTVLALELNRRTYSDEDDYSYGRTASGYIDEPSLEEDKFELDTSEAGKLTLINLTGETYGKVYVYYKYVQVGGIYLGGITYRVPFENVPANGESESPAGHFNPANSRIMAVVVMPE